MQFPEWIKEGIFAAAIGGLVGASTILFSGGQFVGTTNSRLDQLSKSVDELTYELRESERSQLSIRDGEHLQQQIDGISQVVAGLGERCSKCRQRVAKLEALVFKSKTGN